MRKEVNKQLGVFLPVRIPQEVILVKLEQDVNSLSIYCVQYDDGPGGDKWTKER